MTKNQDVLRNRYEFASTRTSPLLEDDRESAIDDEGSSLEA